ncbi:hypothetical protein BLA13014_07246 [Burkholderia aenigmatica]|uniref:Uncharacterized protein n=1 Tax=Burkholderia aenigmatica TaxID=2015348 RepID=A0A6P2S733_9BURK|nr:hypothetical protein BLA13014_07246 [Burkholderia aenigmatica]
MATLKCIGIRISSNYATHNPSVEYPAWFVLIAVPVKTRSVTVVVP